MRAIVSSSVVLCLLCATRAVAQDKVEHEVYAKGYFVKNTVKLEKNPAVFVIKDKKAFDKIFGVGFVMGPRPKLVDAKLFDKHLIVSVIRSGLTPWKYEVKAVRAEKKKLIVEYTATGKKSTAKFTVPLIMSVPRGDYAEVAFIENGKEVGKHAIAK